MTTQVATQQRPGAGLIPEDLGTAMHLAEWMSQGKLVPAHLKTPSDCLMVIEQAMRWGMSPFAVAQCTSVIGGKLMYEGKLVAAVVNASGQLSDKLTYDYSGSGEKRTVVVRGKLKGEKKIREIEIVLEDVKTTNKFWTTQPDQQLGYSGARVWARRHTPELMLGVYSREEFNEPTMKDVTPERPTRGNGNGPDKTWRESDLKDTTVKKWRDFVDEFSGSLIDCRTRADIDAILADNEKKLRQLAQECPGEASELRQAVKDAMTEMQKDDETESANGEAEGVQPPERKATAEQGRTARSENTDDPTEASAPAPERETADSAGLPFVADDGRVILYNGAGEEVSCYERAGNWFNGVKAQIPKEDDARAMLKINERAAQHLMGKNEGGMDMWVDCWNQANVAADAQARTE